MHATSTADRRIVTLRNMRSNVPDRAQAESDSAPNALVQLQAQYKRCDEVASEKCMAAATFVRRQDTWRNDALDTLRPSSALDGPTVV
jgi:hypothetical protein